MQTEHITKSKLLWLAGWFNLAISCRQMKVNLTLVSCHSYKCVEEYRTYTSGETANTTLHNTSLTVQQQRVYTVLLIYLEKFGKQEI